MYILDTNFLIAINNDMSETACEEILSILLKLANQDYLKIPEEVIGELNQKKDKLSEWAQRNKKELIVKTDNILNLIPIVLDKYKEGKNNFSLDSLDLLEKRADPYIIAHALKLNATVVSDEIPCKSGDYKLQDPKNRKIPDICGALGVSYIKNLQFLWYISRL